MITAITAADRVIPIRRPRPHARQLLELAKPCSSKLLQQICKPISFMKKVLSVAVYRNCKDSHNIFIFHHFFVIIIPLPVLSMRQEMYTPRKNRKVMDISFGRA